MIEDKTISTPEAAQILGFTRRWILTLIRRGELDAQRIGRDWRVSRESVEAYLARRGK